MLESRRKRGYYTTTIFATMEELWAGNLPYLKKLFGAATIEQQEKQLKDLLVQTEHNWHANLDRLKNSKVKHILITEAPCNDAGKSQYFYSAIATSYHQKIWKAIFPDTPLPAGMETAYQMLADKGFLLMDAIPFSLKYAGKRDKKEYGLLIANSLNWFQNKLDNQKLKYSGNVKVAFSFKVNGLKMIEATNGQLKLKTGQTSPLTEDLIAADGSGYTNSALVRKIFGLV
jgi:hypothetical protein